MPLRRSRRVYLQPHCCTSWSTGPACAFQLGEESFLIPAPRLFKKLPPLYTRSPQPALLVESRCTTSWGRSPAGGDKAISSGSNEAPPEELLSCYTSLSRVTPPPPTHTHSASLHRISYQKASCHPAKWTHNCSQAAAAKKGGTWEQNQQPEQPGNRTRARGLSGERDQSHRQPLLEQTSAPRGCPFKARAGCNKDKCVTIAPGSGTPQPRDFLPAPVSSPPQKSLTMWKSAAEPA